MDKNLSKKRLMWNVINVISLILLGLSLQIGGAYIVNAAVNCMEQSQGAVGEAAGQYKSYMDAIRSIEPRQIMHVIFVAPLVEEIIFRLVFLRAGKMMLPFWAANLIQAALFGIYHSTTVQKVYGFVMGLIIGCVFYYCPIIYRSRRSAFADGKSSGRNLPGPLDLPNSLFGVALTFFLHMIINSTGLYLAPLLPADIAIPAQFGLGIVLMAVAAGAVYVLWNIASVCMLKSPDIQ